MQVVIGERGHREQSEEGRNGSRGEDRTLTARLRMHTWTPGT